MPQPLGQDCSMPASMICSHICELPQLLCLGGISNLHYSSDMTLRRGCPPFRVGCRMRCPSAIISDNTKKKKENFIKLS